MTPKAHHGVLPTNCSPRIGLLALLSTLLTIRSVAGQQEGGLVPPPYDPLELVSHEQPRILNLLVRDGTRNRDIPLRIYLPAGTAAVPVVLFSHGLGGTREGSTFLGRHWAQRGYVAVFLQHPGSDDSVWKDLPIRQRLAAMQRAASGRNLLLRCQDVTAVLDQLARWQEEEDHPCRGRLDLERVGMSGHSFGAMTTQVTAGQTMPIAGQRLTDGRIDVALVMSPSTPLQGGASNVFSAVKVPWMLMTGTHDTSPIGGQDVASRQKVYPSLPATVDRYELVLHGAEHSVFTDQALGIDRRRRDPGHQRSILALSTAFFDAYLQKDEAARGWLQGEGARSVLAEEDRFQFKTGSVASARDPEPPGDGAKER